MRRISHIGGVIVLCAMIVTGTSCTGATRDSLDATPESSSSIVAPAEQASDTVGGANEVIKQQQQQVEEMTAE